MMHHITSKYKTFLSDSNVYDQMEQKHGELLNMCTLLVTGEEYFHFGRKLEYIARLIYFTYSLEC